nr:superoxide dismutase family protein [Ardenticatenales bacterium]
MSLRRTLLGTIVLLVIATLSGSLSAQASNHMGSLTADIWDVNGRKVGMATLTTLGTGEVQIEMQVAGYNPVAGDHGIHIHDVGLCARPNFASAGPHWNPTGEKHGMHKGDLPTMQFLADGNGFYKVTTKNFQLADLMDANGSAIVIHASPDDYMTDPSGNSGDRIGCGVLASSGAPAPAAPAPAAPTAMPETPAPAPAAPAPSTSASAPALIGPQENVNCFESGGCYFEWAYSGTLAPNQYFQVQMFLPDWKEGRGIHPPTKDMSFHASKNTYAHFLDVCYINDYCALQWT